MQNQTRTKTLNQKLKIHQKRQLKYKKDIKQFIKATKLLLPECQIYQIPLQKDSFKQGNQFQLHLKLLIFDYPLYNQTYQRNAQITLNYQQNSIDIKFFLTKNGCIVTLNTHIRDQFLIRFQMKVNSFPNPLVLSINSQTKSVYFKSKFIFNPLNKQLFLTNYSQIELFSQLISQSLRAFRQRFAIILYLIKQTSLQETSKICKEQLMFNQLIRESKQIKKIEQSIFQIRLNFNFDCQKPNQNEKQINNLIKQKKSIDQQLNTSYNSSNISQDQNSCQNSIFSQFTSSKQNKLKQKTNYELKDKSLLIQLAFILIYKFFTYQTQKIFNLIEPFHLKYKFNMKQTMLLSAHHFDKIQNQIKNLQSSNSFSNKIYQNIQIITPMNKIVWNNLIKGGYGSLQYAKVKFKINQIHNQNHQSIRQEKLVRKQDKQIFYKSKVHHQKKILQTLCDIEAINIKTYFESKQPQYKNYLFSSFQSFLSLDIHLNNNYETFSLVQKLNILIQAANGIRALHKNKIIHLDLKPGNVIIAKNMIGKIIDFGEAYKIGDNLNDYNYGRTIPYAAPQAVNYQPKFTYKSDVYSYGVMVYKIIFDKHIFTSLRDKNVFEDQLIESQINILLSSQNLSYYFEKSVYQIITYLCLMCIERDPEKRPSLDWILSILIQLYAYVCNLLS